MQETAISQAQLDAIFPPETSDRFFEALYGGAEDGAYDIVLTSRNMNDNLANFAFELRRRPDKCLKCSLTYGLPEVFMRHPLINLKKVTGELARTLNWKQYEWELAPVQEVDDDLHIIPLQLRKIV